MSRRAPLIGVSTSITVGARPERAYVNSTYLHAVQQAGGWRAGMRPALELGRQQQTELARDRIGCDVLPELGVWRIVLGEHTGFPPIATW